jgi:hypothetical protein
MVFLERRQDPLKGEDRGGARGVQARAEERGWDRGRRGAPAQGKGSRFLGRRKPGPAKRRPRNLTRSPLRNAVRPRQGDRASRSSRYAGIL